MSNATDFSVLALTGEITALPPQSQAGFEPSLVIQIRGFMNPGSGRPGDKIRGFMDPGLLEKSRWSPSRSGWKSSMILMTMTQRFDVKTASVAYLIRISGNGFHFLWPKRCSSSSLAKLLKTTPQLDWYSIHIYMLCVYIYICINTDMEVMCIPGLISGL